MLGYKETNWKNESGFDIHRYTLTFSSIDASKTRIEQQAKIEKISLVAFLNMNRSKILVNICRRLKRNDNNFYQNKNLHATLFGFGPLQKQDYERIQARIHKFSKEHPVKKLKIKFDSVRPGTMYSWSNRLRPVQKRSNGIVVAIGDVTQNEDFCKYSNNLTLFLLKDKKIKLTLGTNFRRKFPTVWCTLGYYNKKSEFKIGNNLEKIFNQYSNYCGNAFEFPVSEIALVKSKYKNLRYPKLVQKFHL